MEIYVVRHGKTLFNEYGKMQGWCDSPLLPESEELSRKLGEAFKDIPLDAIFSSDSGRVYQTRDFFLKGYQQSVPLFVNQKFREFFFGTIEGSSIKDTWDRLAPKFGYRDFEHSKQHVSLLERVDWAHHDPMSGAETGAEFKVRVAEALEETIQTAKMHDFNTILIVCHGVTTTQLVALAERDGVVAETPDNLTVSKITVEDGVLAVEYKNRTMIAPR